MEIISEKDLYMFVFYPDRLPGVKIDYINLNITKYEEELKLLNEIKASLDEPHSQNIYSKIDEKIIEYSDPSEIILEKIKVNDDSEYNIMYADSPSSLSYVKSETFKDEKNKYLGKVLSSNENTRVFIFKKDKKKFLEFRITLYPSKETYYTNSQDMPLVLIPSQTINRIHLLINNG